jgi:metal-responsive CopG/Arc/MetJ family transcriptional regulator
MNVMLPEALLDRIDAYLGAHPDAQSRNTLIEQALREYLDRIEQEE